MKTIAEQVKTVRPSRQAKPEMHVKGRWMMMDPSAEGGSRLATDAELEAVFAGAHTRPRSQQLTKAA